MVGLDRHLVLWEVYEDSQSYVSTEGQQDVSPLACFELKALKKGLERGHSGPLVFLKAGGASAT